MGFDNGLALCERDFPYLYSGGHHVEQYSHHEFVVNFIVLCWELGMPAHRYIKTAIMAKPLGFCGIYFFQQCICKLSFLSKQI
jgi:hypothetical protein